MKNMKKWIFLGAALACLEISAMDVDPDVQRNLALAQGAGLPTESLTGLQASIKGAWATGARGPALETQAKKFYLDGVLPHNPGARPQASGVSNNLSLIEYAKAVNAIVFATSAPHVAVGVENEVSRLKALVDAAKLHDDARDGLYASIDGANASGGNVEEKAKEYYREGCAQRAPHAAAAVRAVDQRKPFMEYVQAVNVAAGLA